MKFYEYVDALVWITPTKIAMLKKSEIRNLIYSQVLLRSHLPKNFQDHWVKINLEYLSSGKDELFKNFPEKKDTPQLNSKCPGITGVV